MSFGHSSDLYPEKACRDSSGANSIEVRDNVPVTNSPMPRRKPWVHNARDNTFVVVEVVSGHQVIRHWSSSSLTEYINSLLGPDLIEPSSQVSFAAEPASIAPAVQAAAAVSSSTGVVHNHFYFVHEERSTNRDQLSSRPLTARDVRQVFTSGTPIPLIDARRGCVLVCLPPLSCLVMKDRIMFLVTEGIDIDSLLLRLRDLQLGQSICGSTEEERHTDQQVAYEGDLNGGPVAGAEEKVTPPFELAAFEIVVSWALYRLEVDVEGLEEDLRSLGRQKTMHATDAMSRLYQVRADLQTFSRRVRLFDEALDVWLANKTGKLRAFYLSSTPDDHCKEWAALFEFLEQEVEVSRQHIERLNHQMDGTERLITVRLQVLRTSMGRMEAGSGLIGAAFSAGTLISGIFGMNVINSWEDSHLAFLLICLIIVILTFGGLAYSILAIRTTYYI